MKAAEQRTWQSFCCELTWPGWITCQGYICKKTSRDNILLKQLDSCFALCFSKRKADQKAAGDKDKDKAEHSAGPCASPLQTSLLKFLRG